MLAERRARPRSATGVAAGIALVAGASIFHDENGAAVGAAGHAWTATSAGGAAAGPNCDEWSGISGQALIGVIGATTVNWTAWPAQTEPCNATARFYCFEK